jgi:RHS repeat-associated protein
MTDSNGHSHELFWSNPSYGGDGNWHAPDWTVMSGAPTFVAGIAPLLWGQSGNAWMIGIGSSQGKRVARKDFPSGAISYYFSDHINSALVITDSVGNIKAESDYYPWGGELQLSNNDNVIHPPETSARANNDYKFTGKKRDTETGLDYMGARYYGNWTGRFLTPDWTAKPITVPYADFGDPQSLNLYSYVRNSPVSRFDPDGHFQYTPANDANGYENRAANSFCGHWDSFCQMEQMFAQNRGSEEHAKKKPKPKKKPVQQQTPHDDPNNLVLVPITDTGKDHQSYRTIVYEVQTKDGKKPNDIWYVTEHQKNETVAEQDGVKGVSGGNEQNAFTDLIGCMACRNVESEQTFTISEKPGVEAQPFFSIAVHSKDGDFSKLGIHIDSGGPRVNNKLNWFGDSGGP